MWSTGAISLVGRDGFRRSSACECPGRRQGVAVERRRRPRLVAVGIHPRHSRRSLEDERVQVERLAVPERAVADGPVTASKSSAAAEASMRRSAKVDQIVEIVIAGRNRWSACLHKAQRAMARGGSRHCPASPIGAADQSRCSGRAGPERLRRWRTSGNRVRRRCPRLGRKPIPPMASSLPGAGRIAFRDSVARGAIVRERPRGAGMGASEAAYGDWRC